MIVRPSRGASGLFDQNGNNLAAGKSEEQVFELLGFDYVEPQKR